MMMTTVRRMLFAVLSAVLLMGSVFGHPIGGEKGKPAKTDGSKAECSNSALYCSGS